MTQLQQSDALPLMERMLEQVVEQDTKVRVDLESKLERQQGEIEKLREEAVEAKISAARMSATAEAERRVREELTPKPPQEAVSDGQLSALQARLAALHEAKLLTDDEAFVLEDLCADYLELKADMGTVTQVNEVGRRLLKLVTLSDGIPKDGTFARQARRKFV